MGVYRIKPLEWEKEDREYSDVFEQHIAYTPIMRFQVTKHRDIHDNPWWCYDYYYPESYGGGADCVDLEEGKKACEEVWIRKVEELLIKESN
jgi:hypothetical protein